MKSRSNQNDVFRGNKHYLPAKHCASCNRPFSWRKKWAKNWSEVKYCSARCRRLKAGDA